MKSILQPPKVPKRALRVPVPDEVKITTTVPRRIRAEMKMMADLEGITVDAWVANALYTHLAAAQRKDLQRKLHAPESLSH